MNKKSILLIALVVLALVIAGASLAYAQSIRSNTAQDPHSLSGAWLVTATFDPEFQAPPISSPAAFTKDGLVINSNNAGLLSIGVWERLEDNQFAVTFIGYETTEGETVHYQMKANATLNQDGAQFTGQFANDIFDSGGNMLMTVTGTIQGERIEIELLE